MIRRMIENLPFLYIKLNLSNESRFFDHQNRFSGYQELGGELWEKPALVLFYMFPIDRAWNGLMKHLNKIYGS